MAEKNLLFGKTLAQLHEVVQELGMARFTAVQISDWLYKKDIATIDQMTNLSKDNRERLANLYEIGLSEPVQAHISKDGTKKYLYKSSHNRIIEAAFIPETGRSTLCVSSQAGCKMGCLFCMTGKQGFHGQLTAGEILNQIKSLPEFRSLTNIVFMGMGEPFDNLQQVMQSLEILTSDYGFGMSPRRITVSTIGMIPAMKMFLEKSKCNLAVSLNSPFGEQRLQFMPVERAYPLDEVLKTIREYSEEKQRRVSFEYIVFKGLNHSQRHVKELLRKLNGIRCHINLIHYHPIPGSPFDAPNETEVQQFKAALEDRGLTTTIRKSRGQDIFAACGMLSGLSNPSHSA